MLHVGDVAHRLQIILTISIDTWRIPTHSNRRYPQLFNSITGIQNEYPLVLGSPRISQIPYL